MTAAFWNPLEHGAFGYDNLGQSHPLQAITNSRYAQDPAYRAHVHRSLVDPQYALHHIRMRTNPEYANRYQRNEAFRDSVHAKMKDPVFAQHQYRMNTDEGYARNYAEQQAERAAHDHPLAGGFASPSLKDVVNHLRGKTWSPQRSGPPPSTVGAPLPRQHQQHEDTDDFEPFPQHATPTFRDNEEGGMDLITARRRR